MLLLFFFLSVFVCVCVYKCFASTDAWCPQEARIGHQILENWSYR